MIEKSLQEAFDKIFDLKGHSTFDAPSESHEQETLFIEIDSTLTDVKDNILKAKVTGKATVYGNIDKFPMSYFAQKIRAADNDLTKDLFFYDLEQSQMTDSGIVRRGFSFVYFFSSQFNPHTANIETFNVTTG